MNENFNIDSWLSQSKVPHTPNSRPSQHVKASYGTKMDDFVHVRDQIVALCVGANLKSLRARMESRICFA